MNSNIADDYRRFAKVEAHGRSALYEELANYVAVSSVAQNFLSKLPIERQQPNLLFAATRIVAGTPRDTQSFEKALIEHGSKIAEMMLQRTTQTNEPGRCAVLVPVLAQIDGPIALIEVGASAGLCLLPDKYRYQWGENTLSPVSASDTLLPIFSCEASSGTPIPKECPSIVWRAGLDLNPLNVADPDNVAWLETLVWPEDTARLDRLRLAVEVARNEPPTVHKGDLRRDLSRLIDMAPADATIVVFHTAVLSYVSALEDRKNFAREMLASDVLWLCNESPRVFPDFAAKAEPSPSNGLFLMCRNGEPIAWTGPHGQSIHWL